MYFGASDLDVMARQEIEAKIVTKLVDDALAAGFELSVDYDGDLPIRRSRDRAAILGALMECDDEYLVFHNPGSVSAGAWVRLVYGNDGDDVICDYQTSLEGDIKAACDYAEAFEDWRTWSAEAKAKLIRDFMARKAALPPRT